MHALLASLAEMAAGSGIRHAVICPGSRSAPLVIAFCRHPAFQCHVVSDERSAGFIALGLAQRTKTPVVLICTSGSAAYNFAPSVAEAFFQQIPLLVLTADRPPAWIDQLDGQTIRQARLFEPHVKQSWNLLPDYDHPETQWHAQRTWNEALILAAGGAPGPVHINFPFREPLYPSGNEKATPLPARLVTPVVAPPQLTAAQIQQLAEEISAAKKIVVMAGQQPADAPLHVALQRFQEKFQAVVVADIMANVHQLPRVVRFADSFLDCASEQTKKLLQPDLLITFGLSTISKNNKLYWRRFPPAAHWHIQPSGPAADTFQSLTRVIASHPAAFFEGVTGQAPNSVNRDKGVFFEQWNQLNQRAEKATHHFFEQPRPGEFPAVHGLLAAIPPGSALHLANSMPVRYANLIGLPAAKQVDVFGNRGTSGIDGCTSTAVGHCLAGGQMQVLLTGDVAFFYDSNAFWHDAPLQNLRIILLNNHGGAIFGMIDGPAALPELEPFFITRQKRNARLLCEEFGIRYTRYESAGQWASFFDTPGPALIEIETTSGQSRTVYQQFKQFLQASLL